jgi:hypothetical protein
MALVTKLYQRLKLSHLILLRLCIPFVEFFILSVRLMTSKFDLDYWRFMLNRHSTHCSVLPSKGHLHDGESFLPIVVTNRIYYHQVWFVWVCYLLDDGMDGYVGTVSFFSYGQKLHFIRIQGVWRLKLCWHFWPFGSCLSSWSSGSSVRSILLRCSSWFSEVASI